MEHSHSSINFVTIASVFTLFCNFRYVAFDFHHECSKMRWERTSILLENINADLDAFSYFALDNAGKVRIILWHHNIV